jgi:hypothetical protein
LRTVKSKEADVGISIEADLARECRIKGGHRSESAKWGETCGDDTRCVPSTCKQRADPTAEISETKGKTVMHLDRRTFITASAFLGAGTLAFSPTPDAAAEEVKRPVGRPQGDAEASTTSKQLHNQSFLMPAPIDATWRAYTNPEQRKVWWGLASDPLADALEVRPPKFIRSVIDHPGLPGKIENSFTFQRVDGGTQVIVGRSGFGDGPVWENALQTSGHGITEMMGDLALFLRTGVGYPRHTVFRCYDLLKGTREVPGGVEVFEVQSGTLASEIGLQPGDTVVGLGGAGIFSLREVQFVSRAYKPGDVVEVVWVRDGRLLTAKGQMTNTVQLRHG